MTKQIVLNNSKPTTAKGNLIEDILSRGKDVYIGDYGNLIEFYLCGEIGDPEDYIEWFHIINNARESDIIKININSPGGNLFTAVQLLQAFQMSNAHLVMNVAGACMSAATLIFLAGDEYLVNEHSAFLFHNYSGGVIGKGGEMYQSVIHQRKWSEHILRKAYKNFLTEEEIDSLIDDKDIWMDCNVVVERLNARNALLEVEAAAVEAAAAAAAAEPAKTKKRAQKAKN
jgi:ATP-dependent protease ClpP protease subunit